MDAIRELQKQLQAAQAVSNVRKISERNCVDLLQKLMSTGLLKMIHTTSGKEWLTPERLDREIRDALSGSGGRLNVIELPNEVGVAIEHCESRLEHICKADSSLRRLHGDLLSNQYIQTVVQEIEEDLAECGCLAVSDLAAKYNLPADFIRESVLARVGSSSAVIKQNSIYTGTHAARLEARVRGALRGCTQPVMLSQLASRHKLDSDMLPAAIQKLLKTGVLVGKLQGAAFTPQVYADAQSLRVDNFFAANAYLPLSLVKSTGTNLKDWIQSKKADGLTLSTAFIATQIEDSVLASISEAVGSASWVDVQPLLPSSFNLADTLELLQHFTNKKKIPAAGIVLGRAVVSQQWIEHIASLFDAEVAQAAEKSPTSSPPCQEDTSGPKKKSKRAPKGKKGKVADDDDDDGEGGGAGTNTSAGGQSGVDDQVICDRLSQDFPELPEDLHAAVCTHLQVLLVAKVAKARQAVQATLQSKLKTQFEQVEKMVQEKYEKLVFGLKGLDAAGLPNSPLRQYVLREIITEPLHQMLAFRLQEASGSPTEITAANRKSCLDKLTNLEGSTKTSTLVKLCNLLGKSKDVKEVKEPKESKPKDSKGKAKEKDAKTESESKVDEDQVDVAEVYQNAADDCHIFCRKVDKKREKSVPQELRADARSRLADVAVSDALKICCLGLHVALIRDGVVGMLFPEETWALRLLANKLQDETARDDVISLCDLLDKGDDAVSLEAAAAAWKQRSLDAK